MTVVHF